MISVIKLYTIPIKTSVQKFVVYVCCKILWESYCEHASVCWADSKRLKKIFCRFAAMLRNISWKSRRMGQVNMHLLHVQREKQLIRIHRRPQNLVGVFGLFILLLLEGSCGNQLILFLFIILNYEGAPQAMGASQSSAALRDSGYTVGHDSLSIPRNPMVGAPLPWTYSVVPPGCLAHVQKGALCLLKILFLYVLS